ncbi:MAG: winged helix-turn-helix domain-containing protein [bacterium]|nr:winged helix-turn-helix domain-containing protein [bacterium]
MRRRVTVNQARGAGVRLTPTEYRLFLVLMAVNAAKVLTHRQILKSVWGAPYMGGPTYLQVFMAQLRHKIEPDPARRLQFTEAGVGYRIKEGPLGVP